MGTTGVAFGVEVWPRIFQIVYRDLIDYILIIYAILGVKFTLGANVKQSHETGTLLETPSIKYYCMATRAAVACGGKS